MGKSLNKEIFVDRSNKKHTNFYDYSRVNYIDNSTKVEIGCPIHGWFWQRPSSHMKGYGCPKCGRERSNKSWKQSYDELVSRFNIKHNNKYKYPYFDYTNYRDKIDIICEEHGVFKQRIADHMRSKGCRKCHSKSISLNFEEVVKRANQIHNFEYEYLEDGYTNMSGIIKIKCKKHGVFDQLVHTHIYHESKCPKCQKSKLKNTTENVLEELHKKFNNKYTYPDFEYTGGHQKIKAVCPIHGEFEKNLAHHKRGQGCQKCSRYVSYGELEIQDFLKDLGYTLKTSNKEVIKPYELDIFIPSLNKAIEFNGLYWHYIKDAGKAKPKGYHALKSNLCRQKGIKLLHLREDLWLNKKEYMKEVIIKFLER